MNFSKLKKTGGFTIMETVLVLGIFSIATTAAMGIFIQSQRLQRQVSNLQRVMSDARYVLEVVAREVRLGSIDYDFYQSYNLNEPQEILAILDQDSNIERFKKETVEGRDAIQVCLGDGCGSESWADITTANLSVERLSFFISPPDASDNQQSLVTIVLETKNLVGESRAYNFQTTVSSRSYQR
ncbi:prepilin-type N-terminal cleavage/methylation domain-containing protein [Patescibacteria group bacterium]|nr:prepilin-type N-terminal cleavage/methylation domain-containing protein [Patescibacteria group bacterium]